MGFLRDQNILYTLPTTADLSLSNHILSFINGTEPSQSIDYRLIQEASGAVTAVTEVPQAGTYDPVTASAETEYGCIIRQKLSTGQIVQQKFTYNTPATGTINGTLICNNLKTQVRNSNLAVTVAADGAVVGDTVPTMVVTADSGAAIFTSTPLGTTSATFPDGALAVPAIGVYPVGQGADLITEGVTGAVSGRSYTRYDFEYLQRGNSEFGSNPELNRLRVYADDLAVGYAGFNAVMTQIVEAAAGGAADPDAISVA